jgi:hypothetical protein
MHKDQTLLDQKARNPRPRLGPKADDDVIEKSEADDDVIVID